jgi:hypothetical protein
MGRGGRPPFIHEKAKELEIQAEKEGKPVKKLQIWFQDEGRFGLHGLLGRSWSEVGVRPDVPFQIEYEWTWAYAAVCPQTGQSAELLLPRCDGDNFDVFLGELSKQVGEQAHAIVIVDNAKWHHERRFEEFENLTPLHLPPYSPQLNPVERRANALKF